MDRIWAAVIIASVSLVVAIINIIFSFIKEKRMEQFKADTEKNLETFRLGRAKDLEQFKDDLERDRAKDLEQFKDNLEIERAKRQSETVRLERSTEALRLAVAAIQSVKDSLREITFAVGESLDMDSAKSGYSKAMEEVQDCYKSQSDDLEETDRRLFHLVKGRVENIHLRLYKYLEEKELPSDLSADEKRELRELRYELSDMQDQLRDKLHKSRL